MPTFPSRAAGLALGCLLTGIAAAPAAGQQPIRMGQTVTGSLSASDPTLDDGSHHDLYTFRGTRGQVVRVTLRSSDFDAYLAVGPMVGGEMEMAWVDDDAGGGTDARLTAELPEDGTYGIRANSLAEGETGGYTLTLEPGDLADVEPEHAPETDRVDASRAVAVGGGQPVSGTLAAADPTRGDGSHYDLYRFTARPGQRVQATLRSDAFDAFLALGTVEGGEFTEVESDDDGAGGTDARIVRTLHEGGTFYLLANSLDEGETGAYELSVRVVDAPRPVAPTPLAVGASAQGALEETDPLADDESYYDAYAVRLRAGESVTVTLESDDFDAFLAVGRLEGGEFQELETNDDGDDMGTHAQVRFTAPSDGTYVVRANSLAAGETGRYTLRLSGR